jgi:hypothetical protein
MLSDDLVPRPLDPKPPIKPIEPLAAHQLLERYRVLAMAMATRALARHWDSGRIARTADASLVAGASTSFPFEQETLALIGVATGRAEQHVEESERGILQALQDITEVETLLGETGLPLTLVATEFGLSALGKMMLILVAAPSIWGSVHELYRIVANDNARPVVDEYLLAQLFGPSINPHNIATELLMGAPLRSNGLIVVAESSGPPLAALSVPSLVLARLRGDQLVTDPDRPQDDPAPRQLSTLPLDPTTQASLEYWASSEPVNTRLVLRGRLGSGRTDLLRTLAALADRRLHVIDLELLSTSDVTASLRYELARCRVAGWVPCITCISVVAERIALAQVTSILDNYPGPLVVRLLPEEQPPLSPGYRLVELAPLTLSQRELLWRHELAACDLSAEHAEAFATKWRIGPRIIRQVVKRIAASSLAQRNVRNDIDDGVIQHLQSRLGDVAERITRLPSLSDMVLPVDILDSLTEFVARNRLGKQVYETWGMEKVATTGRGITALFQGAPGTGKTMVAGALARELGLDLYRVDLSKIMSKWIGETERNLSNVFSAAEDGHAVILFDEADSLFAKRTEVKSSNDRHANVEVNYLLQRLDSFTGIAVLTTNFGTSIDAAFKRRLSFRLTFPVPDEEIREQLWRKHIPDTIPTGKLDLADLARKFHFSGGSVRNCVMRAAFLAAAEDTILTQEHLRRAIRLEYLSIGKLSEGGPLE